MKKMIISVILAVISASIFVSSAYASGDSKKINVVINGSSVEFTADTGYPFFNADSRTMVPLRAVMETAGATVGYDPDKHTAIIIKDNDRMEVPIGTSYLYYDNEKIVNDTHSEANNGRTYLPIRAVLEAFGYTVEWDAYTCTVNVFNNNYLSEDLVPYSTSDLSTLISEIVKGNVVYIGGKYYATPEYTKRFYNIKTYYSGDDLNTAIYPKESRYGLANEKVVYKTKEWVNVADLQSAGIDFQVFCYEGGFSHKGFYSLGIVSYTLYEMPSLPNSFSKSPYSGKFDGIQIRVEDNEVHFKQSDLMSHGILKEAITEPVRTTR